VLELPEALDSHGDRVYPLGSMSEATLAVQLDPHEARVFGVLVEKALTTPDQYPLSVNAAINGANQKSNRDPVLSLEEHEVAGALERLVKKYMARKVFPGNSRIEKYVHNGKDALNLESTELAVLAELLMRGPQTPGELRARASRMTSLPSLADLMAILSTLMERGFVRRLDPLPGSRAERYVQLLSPDLHPLEAPGAAYTADVSHVAAAAGQGSLAARVEALEAEVAQLRDELRAVVESLKR
jgi:uncharacterized protein YceH (UPF0502 family)